MPNPPILFQSESIAAAPVAGLPCALRVLLALEQDGMDREGPIILGAVNGWSDTRILAQEIERVRPGSQIEFRNADELDEKIAIDGLAILDEGNDDRDPHAILRRAHNRIIANTGKATDGLVSRILNRPISQWISRHALRLLWVRPIHGTIAAGMIGVVMAFCLFLGGDRGLIAGAVLFQLASIIDGVDGEIARATFRSSKSGASLDTATDAATNFAFIAGVSTNLLMSGERLAGAAGLGALALLMIGLTIIGALSLRAGGPLSFDALKHEARATASPMMNFLSKIASRDVYALVLAVLILLGFAPAAIILFATAIVLWFAAAMVMLTRRAMQNS